MPHLPISKSLAVVMAASLAVLVAPMSGAVAASPGPENPVAENPTASSLAPATESQAASEKKGPAKYTGNLLTLAKDSSGSRAKPSNASFERTVVDALAKVGFTSEDLTPSPVAMERIPGGASLISIDLDLTEPQVLEVAHLVRKKSRGFFVSPEKFYYLDATPVLPSDPLFRKQWGVWDTPHPADGRYSSRSPAAWEFGKGANVDVAVLDVGFIAHPDLNANYIQGYDAFSLDQNPFEVAGTAGMVYHGTQVAGVVASVENNGIGGAGAAPKARIMPIRVGDGSNATSRISGAAYLRGIAHIKGRGVEVANMSFGSAVACDSLEQKYLTDTFNAGTTLVAAAGNDSSTKPASPASCANVVAVAAHHWDGYRTSFSNGGSWVDISAPGFSIETTGYKPEYGPASGTSLAAPFVSAAAALIKSANSALTPTQQVSMLIGSAQPFAPGCRCILGDGSSLSGSGYVDAGAAVRRPSPVLGLTATARSKSVALKWQSSYGVANPTGYQVQYSRDGVNWISAPDVPGKDTTSVTVAGLVENVAYKFRMRSVTGAFTSYWSAAVGATPVPNSVPSALTSTRAGSDPAIADSLSVMWGAPNSDGGLPITGVQVEYRLSSSTGPWTTNVYPTTPTKDVSALSPVWITGLATGGAQYSFRLAAVNALGVGAVSTLQASTPLQSPGPVRNLRLESRAVRSVTASWDAPASTGGPYPVTYNVSLWSTDGRAVTNEEVARLSVSDTTPITWNNLNAVRKYFVQVTAVGDPNAVTKPTTVTSNTTFTAVNLKNPTAITAVPATATGVLVSWTAAANSPREPKATYQVQYSADSGKTWPNTIATASTSVSISNLAPSISYLVRVRSMGIGGDFGVWSAPLAVRPGVPEAPTQLQVIPGIRTMSASWVPSASAAASDVKSYAVEVMDDTVLRQFTTTGSPFEVPNVTFGPAYQVRVAAVNSLGVGEFTAWSSVVRSLPVTPAPASVSVAVGYGEVPASWPAPVATDVPPTNYGVEYSSDNGVTWVASPSVTTTSANVLVPTWDAPYLVRVRAVYGSAASSWVVSLPVTPLPALIPGVVSGLYAGGTPGGISLTWTAPSYVGVSALTSYAIDYSTDGLTWLRAAPTGLATSDVKVLGLRANTRYFARVAAVNASGQGAWSDVVSATTPMSVPGAPTVTSVTLGSKSLTANWVPADDNGGTDVRFYSIEIEGPSSQTTWVTVPANVSSYTVSGLVPGAAYRVRVYATNSWGDSLPSAWSTPVRAIA